MERTYSIREVSEMCGLPADTIRYYEKIGLTHSLRNRENNYRSYDLATISNLSSVMTLRSYGMSLEQIRQFFEHPTLELLNDELKDTQETIQQELNALYAKQDKLLRFYTHLGRISSRFNQIMVRQCPRWWGVQIAFDMDIQKIVTEFMNNTDANRPLANYTFIMDKSALINRKREYKKYGLLFEQPYVCQTADYPAIEYPPRQCVYYVYYGRQTETLQGVYDQIMDWIETHHFTVNGDIVEQYILGTPESDLMELWVPVE